MTPVLNAASNEDTIGTDRVVFDPWFLHDEHGTGKKIVFILRNARRREEELTTPLRRDTRATV